MKRILVLFLIFLILFPVGVMAAPLEAPDSEVMVPGGPTWWVHDVQRDKNITLQVRGMPSGKIYQVYLGFIGRKFGQGIIVGSMDNSEGENFTITFDIPAKLRGQRLLAVMVRDYGNEKNYAYNVFANLDDWNSMKPYSLYSINTSSTQSNGNSVEVFAGPTFWVEDVNPNKTFTIGVTGFEGDTPYYVKIGTNDADYEGRIVGHIEPDENYMFRSTFMIPSWLWYKPELKVELVGQYTEHSGAVAFTNTDDWKSVAPYGSYSDIFAIYSRYASFANGPSPYSSIVDVIKGQEVEVALFNFPSNLDLHVTMGRMGTEGIGGYLVDMINTGTGPVVYGSFAIPEELQNEDLIAIRFQSKTTGHFAYDYFPNTDGYNFANSDANTAITGDWTLPPGVYPSTTVLAHVLDESVTLSGVNFTKNDTYNVFMGLIGTQGIGGTFVGTVSMDTTGTFSETFLIPEALQGKAQIAIRFESQNTYYYSYNFWNNN